MRGEKTSLRTGHAENDYQSLASSVQEIEELLIYHKKGRGGGGKKRYRVSSLTKSTLTL